MFPKGVPQRLQQAWIFASGAALGDRLVLSGFPPRPVKYHPAEKSGTFKWNDTQGILSFANEIVSLKGGVSMLMARTHSDIYGVLKAQDVKDSQWLCLKFEGDAGLIRQKWKGYPDPNIMIAFRGGLFCAWKLKEPLERETLFALGSKMAEQFGAKCSTNFIPLPGVPLPSGDIPQMRCFIKGEGVPLSVFGLGSQGCDEEEEDDLKPLRHITEPPMEWRWKGILPKNDIALIMGEPGVGKSTMAMNIAARVSTGAPWPDGSPGCEPGRVVFLENEDSQGETKARAIAAGAHIDRMLAAHQLRDLSTIEGIRELERIAGGDLSALVLSPFSMYFGKITSYKETDIRQLMAPLANWANKKNVSVLGVIHKEPGKGGKSADDASGSKAFTKRCRILLSALVDIEDPIAKVDPKLARRVLVAGKSNNSPDTFKYPYKIIGSGNSSRVEWLERDQTESGQDLDTPIMDSGNVVAMPKQKPEDWLRDRLKDGEVPAKTLEKEAEDAGIPRCKLYRVKDKIGVESTRGGFGAPAVWRLVR